MAEILHISPLAPEGFPDIGVIDGVRFSSAAAGVKYKGRTDVMLAQLSAGSTIAGVFTSSATRSAPVLDCQEKLGLISDEGAAIIVNSGNSNAFTGKIGTDAMKAVVNGVADKLSLSPERVFSASTGVIGEPLPADRIINKLDDLVRDLSENGIEDAARAIMTTDTYAKGAVAEVQIGAKTVKIAGIAKGSGMIAPDMATMLVYLFTDAQVPQEDLQTLLSEVNKYTFNAITVDSDTSTSDTVLLAATGGSKVVVTKDTTEFKAGLHSVMRDLAHQVVRDGEGASKFVEIEVIGAQNERDAKTHAFAIANSPLVKTALAGSDPNWGRIVMAIGKSGALADRDRIKIWFGDILVATDGFVAPSYTENDGATYMQKAELRIRVDIGLGSGCFTAWTCDLTHQYVSINADYRS
ncbi:MAG: bifunctional glutamate N-acetyltransferase/amino-acid acetyltransferase ArgJ [Paracoccaceae bacterium]|jgi:glutamate N-acetyltransferase/amino-acid N-acetyltransferase|nr:bifunctional glutamate N-acetyltransferase/amino-acid acetyltransferase ArgJ [Pseudomonadota bacterium]MDA0852539.1 bifunctional glutamate N-acetyltransferase/amino-acid acetyltransferase ArgJ [Pseudomonadota bacterium]MDA1295835.1 bifunctional glutamate N-acetyltransferase/amino-acid acetyltransferase ArgJ [Pseudomonadota bacterium]